MVAGICRRRLSNVASALLLVWTGLNTIRSAIRDSNACDSWAYSSLVFSQVANDILNCVSSTATVIHHSVHTHTHTHSLSLSLLFSVRAVIIVMIYRHSQWLLNERYRRLFSVTGVYRCLPAVIAASLTVIIRSTITSTTHFNTTTAVSIESRCKAPSTPETMWK